MAAIVAIQPFLLVFSAAPAGARVSCLCGTLKCEGMYWKYWFDEANARASKREDGGQNHARTIPLPRQRDELRAFYSFEEYKRWMGWYWILFGRLRDEVKSKRGIRQIRSQLTPHQRLLYLKIRPTNVSVGLGYAFRLLDKSTDDKCGLSW